MSGNLRVRIVGDDAHAGQTGHVELVEGSVPVAVPPGKRIEEGFILVFLDDPSAGEERCLVAPANIRAIEP